MLHLELAGCKSMVKNCRRCQAQFICSHRTMLITSVASVSRASGTLGKWCVTPVILRVASLSSLQTERVLPKNAGFLNWPCSQHAKRSIKWTVMRNKSLITINWTVGCPERLERRLFAMFNGSFYLKLEWSYRPYAMHHESNYLPTEQALWGVLSYPRSTKARKQCLQMLGVVVGWGICN